jgi:formamidopyrimidine-DNA glycosylase
MPELPEIHTIASDLKKNIEGFVIKGVEIENGYKVNPSNEMFAQRIVGASVDKVARIGKNIVLKLNSDNFITFHLAMTGRILLKDPKLPKDPHQKVQLSLSNNEKNLAIRFCDARMFGKVGVWSGQEIKKLKDKYGPDVIMQEISPTDFLERLKSKNTAIKNALLEQTIVAGLGNIYATDALWMARIHPETKTRELDIERATDLLKSAKEILTEGILHRGSTLPDEAYVDIFGRPGSHQNHFRIYGKTHCPICKSKVDYKKINGRGTYFCPNCQK